MSRKEKPRYDGRHRDYAGPPREGVEPVIRFKNPIGGEVIIDDLIHGRIVISNSELDDVIIARADGTPTYNFCVVVDDMDMGITHVIRGDDHINNTPRQINILAALGVPLPQYAHVPMILGPDQKRLSKRHGAVSVVQYRDEGFLPEAILNYLVRLGWSCGDKEIFSLDEMIQSFDLKDCNKAPSAFNYGKLLWLNQHYIKTLDPVHVARHLSRHLGDLGIDPATGPSPADVLKVQADRAQTLVEMAEISAFFYQDFDAYDETSAKKHLRPVALEPLMRVHDALTALRDWTPEALHGAISDVAESLQVKMGKVAQPLRVAVVGRAASPGIDVTLHLVGKSATTRRIAKAIDYIRQRTEDERS